MDQNTIRLWPESAFSDEEPICYLRKSGSISRGTMLSYFRLQFISPLTTKLKSDSEMHIVLRYISMLSDFGLWLAEK